MLESLVDLPVLLPHSPHVLVNPAGQIHPLVRNNSLRLAAWRVSGNPLKTEEFQRKLLKSYPRHHREVILFSVEKVDGLVS